MQSAGRRRRKEEEEGRLLLLLFVLLYILHRRVSSQSRKTAHTLIYTYTGHHTPHAVVVVRRRGRYTHDVYVCIHVCLTHILSRKIREREREREREMDLEDFRAYICQNFKISRDGSTSLPDGWFDPVPSATEILVPKFEVPPTLSDDRKSEDVLDMLILFRKRVDEFVKCEGAMDLLTVFLSKTEKHFEVGLNLLREAIEVTSGKIAPYQLARTARAFFVKEQQRLPIVIKAMEQSNFFSSILLDNVIFRRVFWGVACRSLLRSTNDSKLLQIFIVNTLKNSDTIVPIHIIHPILHIVHHFEQTLKRHNESILLLEIIQKTVHKYPRTLSEVSGTCGLLCKLFGSDICNGCISNEVSKRLLSLLTVLASYSMSASELRAWIVCVLQCRWRFRSQGDILPSQRAPHVMCNQVVCSLLDATRSTIAQSGGILGTSEIRFPPTSGSKLEIELSPFDRRNKKQQPVLLRGWPNASSFTLSLWFRLHFDESKQEEKEEGCRYVLYRFRSKALDIITECSVFKDQVEIRVGSKDIVRFELDNKDKHSWRHLVVVQARGTKQLFGRTSPSSIIAYVDAKECFRGNLPYPKSSTVKYIFIGTETKSSSWSMGPLYLLNGTLNPIDTLTLWMMGPQYRSMFTQKSMGVLRDTRTMKALSSLEHAGRIVQDVGTSSIVYVSLSLIISLILHFKLYLSINTSEIYYTYNTNSNLSTTQTNSIVQHTIYSYVKPCTESSKIVLRITCGQHKSVYVTDANKDLKCSTQMNSSYVWIPRPWISTMWNSCFGAIPVILALFEWGASTVQGLDLLQALELFEQMTSSSVANESTLEVESVYSIVAEILSAKLDLECVSLEDRHVNAIFNIAISQTNTLTASMKMKTLDVVVHRDESKNGALNIEIDFDNILRFTGDQKEVLCYDTILSVEGTEVTFEKSAFTALREALRRHKNKKSFQLKVRRALDPPPIVTNMLAFDWFMLRWNLWRYLPLNAQRQRLAMIKTVFHGKHINAVHNRILLRSKKDTMCFVERMLICITDSLFDMSLLPEVLDIVADFVLCGSATKEDFELIARFLVSTLISTFAPERRNHMTPSKRGSFMGRDSKRDDNDKQQTFSDSIFLSQPERAFEIRAGLLTMLYKLIIGLPARVFQESHDRDVHGTVISNPARAEFNNVFTTTWILTFMITSYDDIETLLSIAGSRKYDPADNAILALRVLVAITPIQWRNMSEIHRRTFFEMLAFAVEKTWHCAQSVRVLTMLVCFFFLSASSLLSFRQIHTLTYTKS